MVKVIVPATNGVTLHELFNLGEFMKVMCTLMKEVGRGNILTERERDRAEAGVAGAHQLRRTPSAGGEG